MKSNKLLLLILTVSFLLTLTGCNSPTTEFDTVYIQMEDTETVQPETESTEVLAEPEILRFVDAHGEWFETEIVSSAKKHPYNWDLLTNDETGISYEDENYRLIHGIDVSKWQGKIDWDKVKAEGYEFVIIRMGYRGYSEAGGLALDEMFYQNIQGAQAAGLDVGVYFFSQAITENEAIDEANYVLNLIDVCERLIARLRNMKNDPLHTKYGITFDENTLDNDVLKQIGKKRGCLIKGGEIDVERACKVLLTEFRAGKLGKICLE